MEVLAEIHLTTYPIPNDSTTDSREGLLFTLVHISFTSIGNTLINGAIEGSSQSSLRLGGEASPIRKSRLILVRPIPFEI